MHEGSTRMPRNGPLLRSNRERCGFRESIVDSIQIQSRAIPRNDDNIEPASRYQCCGLYALPACLRLGWGLRLNKLQQDLSLNVTISLETIVGSAVYSKP